MEILQLQRQPSPEKHCFSSLLLVNRFRFRRDMDKHVMGSACKSSLKVSNSFAIYKSNLQPLSQTIPSSHFYLSWLFLNGVLYNKFDKENSAAINKTRCTRFFMPHINDNDAFALGPAQPDDDLHGYNVETKRKGICCCKRQLSFACQRARETFKFPCFHQF